MIIGWRYINATHAEALAVLGMGYPQGSGAIEDMRQNAGAARRGVHDDEDAVPPILNGQALDLGDPHE